MELNSYNLANGFAIAVLTMEVEPVDRHISSGRELTALYGVRKIEFADRGSAPTTCAAFDAH